MNERKTALVFTGGGSLGAVHVGMLRALSAAGVVPDLVVGVSVGAINACYFAGDPTAKGVAQLEQIWLRLRRADVFPFTVASAFRLLWRRNFLIDPSRLRQLIESNLAYALLEDAAIPVHVVATDMQGSAVLLSRGPAIEAILASVAVPGVFPLVEIDGRSLMDGAIATGAPVRLAMELGASRIVVLPTGYACSLKAPPSDAIATALHAITLMIDRRLTRDLERLPESIDVHLAPCLCPLDVSPYDFSASRPLIERAAKATTEWIARGGLTRRFSPREHADHRRCPRARENPERGKGLGDGCTGAEQSI